MSRRQLVLTGSAASFEHKIYGDGSEVGYLNVCMPANRLEIAGPLQAATYSDHRTSAIIDKPSEWQMSVVRFRVPTAWIPICFMGIQVAPNTSINQTTYAVSIQCPGQATSASYVVWSPEDKSAAVPVAPGSGLTSAFSGLDANLPYYSLYSYGHFIGLINDALAAAFATASVLGGWPAAATAPPVLTFDSATQLVSLNAQTAYDTRSGGTLVLTTTGTLATGSVTVTGLASVAGLAVGQAVSGTGIPAGTTVASLVSGTSITLSGMPTLSGAGVTLAFRSVIKIYFNSELMEFFQSTWETLFNGFGGVGAGATNIDYQLMVYAKGDNVRASGALSGYLQMAQEYPALGLWTDLTSIQFTSSLPTKPEFSALTSSSAESSTVPIVTDYEPIISGSGSEVRTDITYVPSGEYRMVDLLGDAPFSSFTMSVYWADQFGRRYPVYLAHNACVSAKVMFRRRDRCR